MKLSSGLVLGERYRLDRPLGAGGMGEVWAATHMVTGRPVALKRLLPALSTGADDQARARFVLEAQAACAVEHPNVVEILDYMEPEDEAPVIVMELLQGETLAARLAREHVLSLAETANVILPVASAVGTAHARGVVHRDLKPANIFLTRRGEGEPVVKVLDFGIAKWLVPRAGEAAPRTQTGSTLGTPSYMAPEQAVGDRRIDHRVDVWSLGVVLYECLSGARPVEGENAAHMMMRLMSTGIIPIGQLVPGLPRELGDLIGRMLARQPSRRPRDMREVCAALAPHAKRSVPSFGEPQVQSVGADDLAVASSTVAPHVSWGETASHAGATRAGERGGRASGQGPPRARLFATAIALCGFALAAMEWHRAASSSIRPAIAAPTASARSTDVRDDRAVAPAAPGPSAELPTAEVDSESRPELAAAVASSRATAILGLTVHPNARPWPATSGHVETRDAPRAAPRSPLASPPPVAPAAASASAISAGRTVPPAPAPHDPLDIHLK